LTHVVLTRIRDSGHGPIVQVVELGSARSESPRHFIHSRIMTGSLDTARLRARDSCTTTSGKRTHFGRRPAIVSESRKEGGRYLSRRGRIRETWRGLLPVRSVVSRPHSSMLRVNRLGPLRVVLSQSHLSHFSLRVFKSPSHILVLSQDINEYAMHVLIVNTRYPTSILSSCHWQETSIAAQSGPRISNLR
jgi:hypothetical protein